MVWETNIPGPGVPIGSDFTLRVVVTSNGEPHGERQNMADVELEAVVRLRGSTSGAPVIRVENAAIATEPEEGGDPLMENVVLVPLPAEETGQLLPGVYGWAVWRVTDGATRPLAFGEIPFVGVPLPGA